MYLAVLGSPNVKRRVGFYVGTKILEEFASSLFRVVTNLKRRVHIINYYSGNQIEKNEMGGHVALWRKKRGAYRILVGRPEGRRPLGTPRLRWENNIKMVLQEVEWGMDWIELA
jgi:hypothetical protein